MAQPTINRVEIDLQDRMRFQALNPDRVSVTLDASPEYGGSGGAFSPMEMLLIGLGACTAMDVISILRKKRQDVTGYRVEVEGVRAGQHPKTFTEISLRHIVQGNNVSEEAVRHSIELSETKYCSAFAMLQHAAQISSTFEVHPAVPVDCYDQS